jgi:putative aldouronate transport system permease protein
MAYPFYYILCYSISNPGKIIPGFLLAPRGFSLQSYQDVFTVSRLDKALFVSVARSIVTPVLMIFVSSMAAYSLSKNELPARKFFMLLFIFTMYIDPGLIPVYLLISRLHINHSFMVYVLPSLVGVFNLILIKTYMESIPPALEESAWIEGADYFTAYSRIVMPVCKPILAAVMLFAIVGQWNAYIDTMLYNAEDSQLHTLSYVLMQYVQNTMNTYEEVRKSGGTAGRYINTTSIRMAITAICIVPIACVDPVIQKHFVKGIMIGAIKG